MQRTQFLLLFKGEEVGETLLEDGEDGVQDGLVIDGQVGLCAVLMRLDLQDDDLGGLLLGGQQDQVLGALIIHGVDQLKLHLVAFSSVRERMLISSSFSSSSLAIGKILLVFGSFIVSGDFPDVKGHFLLDDPTAQW